MGDINEPRFLRSNAIIEPLVDRFYAWLHTVAPVQASMNLANRAGAAARVVSAVPAGARRRQHQPGPARRLLRRTSPEERSTEVAELLDTIKRDRADMLAFAAAIAEAEELLRQSADRLRPHPALPEAAGRAERPGGAGLRHQQPGRRCTSSSRWSTTARATTSGASRCSCRWTTASSGRSS